MDKYISTDALIKELKRRDFLPVIVKQAIDAVPAADVVEVVRCYQCKHFVPYETPNVILEWLESQDGICKEDGECEKDRMESCRYGERKDVSNETD